MILNISQAAKALNVSEISIRRLVRTKGIQHRRIGRRILFTESDLNSFLENVKVAAVHEKGIIDAKV